MPKQEQFPLYQPPNEILEVLPYPKEKKRSLSEKFKLSHLELLGKMQHVFKSPKPLKGIASKLKNSIENQQLKSTEDDQLQSSSNGIISETQKVSEFTDESARLITLRDKDDPELHRIMTEQSGDEDPIATEEIQAIKLLVILQDESSIDWVPSYGGKSATLTLLDNSTRPDGDELITERSSKTLFIDHDFKSQAYMLRYTGTASKTGGDSPIFTRESEEITINPLQKLCTVTQTVNDQAIRGHGHGLMSYDLLVKNTKILDDTI